MSDPSAVEAVPKKMFLRSKLNPDFTIEVGPSVINSCSVLKGVEEHTKRDDAVEVEMTQKQLEQFVALHTHFADSDPLGTKDPEWTSAFFNTMPEADFKDLCWKADFLDSQRFLEASGDYVLQKFDNMDVPAIQEYLGVVDDYTPEERQAMEANPLEFFTGISIQNEEANNGDH